MGVSTMAGAAAARPMMMAPPPTSRIRSGIMALAALLPSVSRNSASRMGSSTGAATRTERSSASSGERCADTRLPIRRCLGRKASTASPADATTNKPTRSPGPTSAKAKPPVVAATAQHTEVHIRIRPYAPDRSPSAASAIASVMGDQAAMPTQAMTMPAENISTFGPLSRMVAPAAAANRPLTTTLRSRPSGPSASRPQTGNESIEANAARPSTRPMVAASMPRSVSRSTGNGSRNPDARPCAPKSIRMRAKDTWKGRLG